jgi:hypothetical protein
LRGTCPGIGRILSCHLENDFQLNRGAGRKACYAKHQAARALVFAEDVFEQFAGASGVILSLGANQDYHGACIYGVGGFFEGRGGVQKIVGT